LNSKYPKISIVTVNLNQVKFLEECILSVLDQNYPNLEYIIIDGGSSDGSVDIIKKYENRITYWESTKDKGQYYALQKGLSKTTGEIMAWINSDDKYLPKSFIAIAQIFQCFPSISWLTSVAKEYTEEGILVNRITPQWSQWSKTRYLTYDFQFIQQESTFWKRSLWEVAGGHIDTEFELAGDMELWARFFRYEELHTTVASIAGFRYRKLNQRSRLFLDKYLNESKNIIKRERRMLPFLSNIKYTLLRPFGMFLSIFFFLDIPFLRKLYSFLYCIPTLITYDFDQHQFIQKNYLVKLPSLFIFGKQVHRKMKFKNDE